MTAISGCFLVVFFFSESLICTLKRYKISFLSVLVENCAIITNSNMTSFFRFVNNWVIYRLGIISLAHTPVHVTDFPVVNVHVDELSSAWIWQHKLCATLSANVNINYRLPIKVYYCICTLRHIKIKINNGRQNVFWVLTWVGR